jgi:hypothetical protein
MVDEAQRQRQYIGESPNFSRGNLDVRYPVDSAVQNAHRRPSNRQPLLNQPPMQRPQPQQRPHVNPRMRHINPRGMNKTVDPLYNLMAQQAGAFGGSGGQRAERIHNFLKDSRSPSGSYLANKFGNTYPHELQHQGDTKQHPNPRMRGMMGGLGGLQEQAAVDPSDWRTILRILEAGGDPGTETALNIGDTFPLEGHGRTRPYGGTKDMGPKYEELETIPLDLQFDQWGYPIGQDDWGYIGAARGGLMSLRR